MGSPNLPQTAIIITAWNQLDITISCMQSIVDAELSDVSIILVDNGSERPLGPDVKAKFPMVQTIRVEKNLGFSGGYNIGMQAALDQGAEFLYMINNDTLLEKSCVDILRAHLVSADSHIAGVAPKIYYAAEPTRIWSAGCDFRPVLMEIEGDSRGVIDEGQFSEIRTIEFIPFCAIMLRRSVIENVGLLDDTFFLYYEDYDYCQRLKQAGLTLQFIPDAVIYHDASYSSGGEESPNSRYYHAVSSGTYFRKHGRGLAWLAIIPFRTASAIRKTIKYTRTGQWDTLRAHWRGLYEGWVLHLFRA